MDIQLAAEERVYLVEDRLSLDEIQVRATGPGGDRPLLPAHLTRPLRSRFGCRRGDDRGRVTRQLDVRLPGHQLIVPGRAHDL